MDPSFGSRTNFLDEQCGKCENSTDSKIHKIITFQKSAINKVASIGILKVGIKL